VKTTGVCIGIITLTVACQQTTLAADILNSMQTLTERVSLLEAKESQLSEIVHSGTGGAAAFLFGAFCALWAQNTNRNAWLWFFMGLLFNVVTVVVLLVKNSNDRKTGAQVVT